MSTTTFTTTDKIAAIQIGIESDIERTRADLAKAARFLARDMERLAEYLENDADARPNELGEIQGRGTKIDAMCAKLAELHRMQDRLAYIVAE